MCIWNYDEIELAADSTCAFFAQVKLTEVIRQVERKRLNGKKS